MQNAKTLKDLLSGSQKAKGKIRKNKSKNGGGSNKKNIVNDVLSNETITSMTKKGTLEETSEDIIELDDDHFDLNAISPIVSLNKSKLKPIEIIDNAKSMTSLLMSRDKPSLSTGQLDSKANEEIIDLENLDETIDIPDSIETLKNTKRLASTVDMKKTSLKTLFNNFSKPIQNNDSKSSAPSNSVEYAYKWERKDDISKLKELDPLQPKLSHIKDLTPNDTDITDNSKFLIDSTYQKKNNNINSNFTVSPNDYFTFFNDYKKIDNENDNGNSDCKLTFNTPSAKLTQIWTTTFTPDSLNDVLLDSDIKQKALTWITNAFEKLKRPTKRNKLKNKNWEEELMIEQFIVGDDGDPHTNSTSVEEFVPLMILYGDSIGKNTLLQVIMNELNGKIFEVNSSANRSKKDILETLSEFSTSYDVKDKNVKSIILIDDVDVIFHGHDRFFWITIERLLLTSRRPIVLTCRDVNFIPSNIITTSLEENSLFEVSNNKKENIKDYIKHCCESISLNLDDKALEYVIKKCNYDIRQTMLLLQFLCSNNVPYEIPNLPKYRDYSSINDIKTLANYTDLVSQTQNLHSLTKYSSLITEPLDFTLYGFNNKKAETSNEEDVDLVNDYMEDYRIHLQESSHFELKPYELDISKYLAEKLEINLKEGPLSSQIYENFKVITDASLKFLNSRKKHPHDSVRKTRSATQTTTAAYDLELQQLTTDTALEYLVNISLANRSATCIDINPYIFEIAKNEKYIREYDTELIKSIRSEEPDRSVIEITLELKRTELLRDFYFGLDPKLVLDTWE